MYNYIDIIVTLVVSCCGHCHYHWGPT